MAYRTRSNSEVPVHQGPVLVDTNVILEAHRVGSWRPLVGRYAVETVETCLAETQTGHQRRRPERRIDERDLRGTLAAVHHVTDLELAELAVRMDERAPGISLDEGERSLWAHALGRHDNWVFCGPDRASLRVGIKLGHREQFRSLERLLCEVGARPKRKLGTAYTEQWLANAVNQIAVLE